MKQAEEYDRLVLGSGEAGKYIAWTLAKKGMKTALIERKYVGGSCPNIACLPSKNVIFPHPTLLEGLMPLFSNVPPPSAPVSKAQVLHA
jgi:ribulose 1,5-bisphosphate synthetase/thiazole synthase